MIRTGNFIERARQDASTWANDLLSLDPSEWVILDTETTGFSKNAQVIQIGIVDGAGTPIMDDTLILPTVDVDPEARMVHGITDAQLIQRGVGFLSVMPLLQQAVAGKALIVYNLDFDMRLLKQTALVHGMDLSFGISSNELVSISNDELIRLKIYLKAQDCAMHKYAEWHGEFNQKRGSFRWQPLPGGDHSAVGDCQAVLKLIKRMAGRA